MQNDPNDPKYLMFVWLWRHMPLSLSKRLGPKVREWLGL